MNHLLGFVLALVLAPTIVSAQETDVPADIVGLDFVCSAQQATATSPVEAPGQSLSFSRSDGGPLVPVCVDATDIGTVSFQIPFDAAFPNPTVEAFAHSGPGCSGDVSLPSANVCVVSYTVASPLIVENP